MYSIITALAAVLTTLFWYRLSVDKYQLSTLCFIYWGAALMWFVDHVIAYFMEGGEFFEITLDATMLGFTVVLSGFFLWVLMLLVKARKGTLKN